MPNLPLSLNQFKDEVYNWIYNNHDTIKEIARRLATRLGRPYIARTLKNRLQKWGFSQMNKVNDSIELRLQIAILFQQLYSDKNIVRQL